MTDSKLIFGAGYLGSRAARRWLDAGSAVHVVTRSPARAAEFRTAGYDATVADVTRPETLVNLPAAGTILFAVGYDRNAGPDIRSVYAGGVENVLSALAESCGRFIYISSTGVYGDAEGGWVDERTPPDPQRAGGKASLAAESALIQSSVGGRSIVLRLAGLYGPGRVPYLQQIRDGAPIPVPSNGWLNLIHVEDAARTVCATEQWADARDAAEGPATFCVSDGRPVRRAEYYREVARLLDAPEVQFVAPSAESPAAARAQTDRRISNRRMMDQLAVALAFPSYQQGLTSILCGGRDY